MKSKGFILALAALSAIVVLGAMYMSFQRNNQVRQERANLPALTDKDTNPAALTLPLQSLG